MVIGNHALVANKPICKFAYIQNKISYLELDLNNKLSSNLIFYLILEVILYDTTILLASSNTSLWKFLRYISVVFKEL